MEKLRKELTGIDRMNRIKKDWESVIANLTSQMCSLKSVLCHPLLS
jgi:hypothetical protein